MSLLKEENDETPVQWFTFYSEKHGRDYYYEPNSAVVTWIRPDDLHVHPTVPTTPPKEEEEEVVERRVSFHASVNNEHDDVVPLQQQERGMLVDVDVDAAPTNNNQVNTSIGSSSTKRRQIPIFLLIFLVCVLVLVGSYMEWLPRGPLGSVVFGNDNGQSITGETRSNTKPREQQQPKRPTTADRRSQEREKNAKKEPPVHGYNHEARHSRAQSQKEKETTILPPGHQHYQQKDAKKCPFLKARHVDDESIDDKQKDAAVNQKESLSERRDPDEESPKRKCLVPFAHVFSRKCRKKLAEKPVYDMDALLDSLI